ncbi:hypothetical protein DH2020_035671 [Rehmannia glutinosa]|uniref:tRNA-guanine(15) transglycosylase-like domain-containing protein n=1 Tax=Rehmannia glutinosa TaxID=99300 RepID=A0ABR0V8L4_REHGL
MEQGRLSGRATPGGQLFDRNSSSPPQYSQGPARFYLPRPSLFSPYARLAPPPIQPSSLISSEGISLKTISELGGLHQMLGLHEHVFAAVPRDSTISLPDYQSSNRMGASFETPCGRLLIKPLQYMEMISSMKPNMWATLADEVPAWVSEKRNKASVDRTTGGAVFGSIVGGSKIEERKRCAEAVAERNVSGNLISEVGNTMPLGSVRKWSGCDRETDDILGFCLGGFGLGESMDERPSLLGAITNVKEILPEEKPRQICGLGLPEEVLQGVAAGIDLFDSTYIYHLTLGGFALTFPLEEIRRHGYGDQLSDTGRDGSKINLKATIYRKDTSPILEGCKCYTCQNHTKAYINHLLNVHEMLAQILLEMYVPNSLPIAVALFLGRVILTRNFCHLSSHNTHHYLGFFQMIREAIKGGTFEEFRQNFVETRRDHILAAALSA